MTVSQERWSAALRSTMLANTLLVSMGVVTGVLLARGLGPAGNGDLTAIRTIPLIVGSVAVLGMPDAVVFFSAKRPKAIGTTLATGTVVALISTCVAAIITAVILPTILSTYSVEIVRVAQVFVLMGPLMGSVGLLIEPFRALGMTDTWNWLRVLPGGLWTLYIAVSAFEGSLNAESLALVQLALTAAVGFPFAYIVWRKLRPRLRWDHRVALRMIKYGIPATLITLPSLLNSRIDLVVVTILAPASVLGNYAVALTAAGVVTPLMISMGQVALPKVASISSEKEAAVTLASVGRANIVFLAVAAMPILILTPLLLPIIFGAEYKNAALPATVLAISAGITGLNFNLGQSIRGTGTQAVVVLGQSLGAVVTAVAVASLVHALSMMGAAIGSLIGSTATTVVLAVWWHRKFRMPLRQLLLPRPREAIQWISRVTGLA